MKSKFINYYSNFFVLTQKLLIILFLCREKKNFFDNVMSDDLYLIYYARAGI